VSEADETREKRRHFLRAVYDLANGTPSNPVRGSDVAQRLGMDIRDDWDEFHDLAQYHRQAGNIEVLETMYGTLRITMAGIREVEKNVPQISRQEKRHRLLRSIYDLSGGRPTEFVDWRDVAPRLGLEAENQADTDEGKAMADYLESSGLISIVVNEGTVYRITAKGIDEVENRGSQGVFANTRVTPDEFSDVTAAGETPVEIYDSIRRFREDYPDPASVTFILMQFGSTRAHDEIAGAIKVALAEHSITGVRADDKRYHDDLFYNVLTYMHGCGFGIAVFERIEEDRFNPNVSLEVGYLFAMRKPVCLLKDQTLETLHADLVGRLYDPFDPQDPARTIPPKVSKWLLDKGLV
jgi:hypothetical protein